MQHKLHPKIIDMAAPLAQAQNLKIWGLEIVEGESLFLRLYVENDSSNPSSSAQAETEPQSHSASIENTAAHAKAASASSKKSKKKQSKESVSENCLSEECSEEYLGEYSEEYIPSNPSLGVSVEECAKLSRSLGFILETEDVVPTAYTLEVSSPGLERSFFNIQQIAPYFGKKIALALVATVSEYPGHKNIIGQISSINKDETSFLFLPDAALDPKGKALEINIDWTNVKKANLIHDFEAGKGQKRKKKD